jgi:hypothetical protein
MFRLHDPRYIVNSFAVPDEKKKDHVEGSKNVAEEEFF